MGIEFKQIKKDNSIINSQIDAEYESSSVFRDAFSEFMGITPIKAKHMAKELILKAEWINTILGPMIAISDQEELYLLEFTNKRGLAKEIEKLRKKTAIIPGNTKPISMIKQELELYFAGKLKVFKTPLHIMGSPFQNKAWNALMKIPYGHTRSYLEQAKITGNEKAFRAVANANGANQLAVVIPCHRIINNNGDLGGYGGGIEKKQWLLHHEKQNSK